MLLIGLVLLMKGNHLLGAGKLVVPNKLCVAARLVVLNERK